MRGVYQRYIDPKSGKPHTVLNHIDLTIPKGEFVAIVGPSGSGKTRLLNIIGGFERARSGEVLIDGKPAGPPDRHRGIVTQKYSLFPFLTVLENIAFGLELEDVDFMEKWLRPFHYRRLVRRHREKARKYLEKVRLSGHAEKYPHQLSGGMQQRVAIAQALIMNPTILLMDEPFGALDPGTRTSLQELMIETHRREGNTIFFVTHDLEEAVFVADRVLVISPYFEPRPGERAQGGSRIVCDIEIPRFETPGEKRAANLHEIHETILRSGFYPKGVKEA